MFKFESNLENLKNYCKKDLLQWQCFFYELKVNKLQLSNIQSYIEYVMSTKKLDWNTVEMIYNYCTYMLYINNINIYNYIQFIFIQIYICIYTYTNIYTTT